MLCVFLGPTSYRFGCSTTHPVQLTVSRSSNATCTVVTHAHPVQDCLEKLFQGLSSLPPTTFIPCRHIASRDYDDWDYAMFIVGS